MVLISAIVSTALIPDMELIPSLDTRSMPASSSAPFSPVGVTHTIATEALGSTCPLLMAALNITAASITAAAVTAMVMKKKGIR